MVRAEEVSQALAALAREVSTLDERHTSVRRDIESLNSRCARTEEGLSETKLKMAVLEERLAELKKGLEEASRRKAAFLPPLLTGLLGGILAILGQLLIRKLFP